MIKVCNICKQEKAASEFSKNRRNKDGLQTECKSCRGSLRAKNKYKNNIYLKAWRSRNKDAVKKHQCTENQKKARAKYDKQSRDKLSTLYIRQFLSSRKWAVSLGLNYSSWSTEMVELQRQALKAKRLYLKIKGVVK